MADPDLELAVQRIGRELADLSAGLTPTVFTPDWWTGALLEWCLKDEPFKVQLFRFIDVLPALRRDEQAARLFEEYFRGTDLGAGVLGWGMRAAAATGLGARLSGKALRAQVDRMARTFIAGPSAAEALPRLLDLWRSGRGCSVDLLGETTVSEREADQYRDRCLDALRLLGQATPAWPATPLLERDQFGPVPRAQLSVKLSALYSQLDPIDPEGSFAAVAGRLRPILDLAVALPAAVTFDMEHAELKDLTLDIFTRLLSEDAYRAYPHGGIALQAYHKDSAADLDRLLRWVRQRGAPITVRLVKGAYWDSDTIMHRQRGWSVPVFAHKWETDASYEALTRTLIAHADRVRPAFGTHNLRSLAQAEAAAQASGLAPEAYEYQMIYGMAEPLQAAVVKYGRRLRIYVPLGEILPGMAYLVRRLLENTSNESFLRRRYVESVPLEELLAPPRSPAATIQEGPAEESHHAQADRFVNEPHADFSQAAVRERMARAVADVRKHLGRTYTYWTAPGLRPTGPELVSENPSAPAEPVGRLQGLAPADVGQAVEVARAHAAAWRSRPAEERARFLVEAAALMRQRRFELAAWEVFEVGKPWREADADVTEAIDFLEFYARQMRRLAEPRRLGTEPGELNHLHYAPRGVAAVIAPWNFPLAIPTGMVSAALVTGNPVLFKPSERAPVLGHWLVELLIEAGIPRGVLQFLPGGPEVGRALVSAGVDLIAFTGSQAVGLDIVAQAARPRPGQRSVTRVIAEMGGKNAIIVDESADLDEAVAGVVASFTGYQGQKCSACARAIVHEEVHDLFLRRLTDAVMSLRIGPPEDPGNRVGPMIDGRALAKVRDYIEIGKREGRLVVERKVEAQEGYFLGPAVFAEIRPEHRLAQEEIFGPVLAVLRARDFAEALRFANSTAYALTGGLYSRSPEHIARAREQFDVGNLYINRPITGALVGRQPFGGHRLSGVGTKAGGEDYLREFLVARVVTENTIRRGFAPAE
ncbi:proline dehydrogenase family protein [Nitrospira sp. Kam-Ns4a]